MDTIAAIATALQPSAVGILRLSGDTAAAVLAKVFRPDFGTHPLPPRRLVYGTLLDDEGRLLDRVLAVYFPAPHSYTGEDCAELQCHGSPAVLQEGLRSLFSAGARQATAGEFTRRAFLHGRMDLTEAEAVMDLIEAETADQARNAAGQNGGLLRRTIEKIYEELLAVSARFYAVVDYPDEDIEDVDRPQIEAALTEAERSLRTLLATCRRGSVLKNGLPVALIGRPNVGKSSLLNAILGRERAIVTEIAGTTRDTVEEKVLLGGVTVRLCDTAGLRRTEDRAEQLGVDRAKEAAQRSALVLLLLDASQPLTAEDEAAMETAEQTARVLLVRNKCDLPAAWEGESLRERFPQQISVSAKDGTGLEALESFVAEQFGGGEVPCGQVLTNPRQEAAAMRALEAVLRAQSALAGGLTPDAVLTDVEDALSALGALSGRSVGQDVVTEIFSRFCVGK